jgi:hypothetical protein
MDDVMPAAVDPAIMDSAHDDSLIQFVPGEDMIAAHKRAMKTRDAAGEWRGKPLAAFFGGEPVAVDSAGGPSGAQVTKNRVFNAADYLRPTTAVPEGEVEIEEGASPQAFSSRFRTLFGGVNDAPSQPHVISRPDPPLRLRDVPPVDDRMARLMGLLSTKVSSDLEAR